MYLTRGETDIVGTLEAALDATMKAEAVEAKVRAAQKVKRISGRTPEELVQAALAAHVISTAEQAMLARASKLRDQVVKVDDFPQDFDAAAQATPAVPQRAAACGCVQRSAARRSAPRSSRGAARCSHGRTRSRARAIRCFPARRRIARTPPSVRRITAKGR
jgi:hypothetical protein